MIHQAATPTALAPIPTLLSTFGEFGHVPVLKHKYRIAPRAIIARYVKRLTEKLIGVRKSQNSEYLNARSVDLHLYNPQNDSTLTTTVAISSTLHHLLKKPQTAAQARMYKYAVSWAIAHSKEVETIGKQNTFKLIHNNRVTKGVNVIPHNMNYHCKHSHTLKLDCKSRFSVRGEITQRSLHYDPNHTTSHMTKKQQFNSSSL